MNSKILNAIGRIDESIIYEAEEAQSGKYFAKRKRDFYMRLISAAASFVLCFCIVLPVLMFVFTPAATPDGGDMFPDGDSPWWKGVGGAYTNKYGTVTFESVSDNAVTLLFDKETDDVFYVLFYGYELTEENGELVQTDFYACTNPEYEGAYGVKMEGALSIKVNGADTELLPAAAGEYRIEIDFSKLIGESSFVYPDFTVSGMGDFSMEHVDKSSSIENTYVYLKSVFADSTNNCDTVLLEVNVNERISAPDRYIQQLYVRDANGALENASAFGERLSAIKIAGKEYFVLDLSSIEAEYRTKLYLRLEYTFGTFTNTSVRSSKLDVFLNGTEDSCRGEFWFLYDANELSPQLELLSSVEALAQYRQIAVPASFPCEVSLIKQILFEPDTGMFSYSYKITGEQDLKYWVTISSMNQEQYDSWFKSLQGAALLPQYTANGIEFRFSELASDSRYPAYDIVYGYQNNYYRADVVFPLKFELEEFLSGFVVLENA